MKRKKWIVISVLFLAVLLIGYLSTSIWISIQVDRSLTMIYNSRGQCSGDDLPISMNANQIRFLNYREGYYDKNDCIITEDHKRLFPFTLHTFFTATTWTRYTYTQYREDTDEMLGGGHQVVIQLRIQLIHGKWTLTEIIQPDL